MSDVQEARRAAVQIIAELDRGMQIIEGQLKAGQFMAARDTAKACRALVEVQERLFRAYFKAAR